MHVPSVLRQANEQGGDRPAGSGTWRDARASAAQHVLSKNHTFRKKRPIWSGACYMYTVTHNYNF